MDDFELGNDYITVGNLNEEADRERLRVFSAAARDRASYEHGWPRVLDSANKAVGVRDSRGVVGQLDGGWESTSV